MMGVLQASAFISFLIYLIGGEGSRLRSFL